MTKTIDVVFNTGNMSQPLGGQGHDRTALVLYGSETGNSQDVAEELGRLVERLHFVTRVSEMDHVEIRDLLKYTVVLVAVSTTGQGEFPKNARKFWKSLLRKRLPPGCLDHVSFTTFGLGDSSYPRFNFSGRKLHKRLQQLGAKEVYPRGEADEQHDEGIDGTFLSWSFDLRKTLLLSYPLPEGVEPIPPEVLLPPKFELEILSEAKPTVRDILSTTTTEEHANFSPSKVNEAIPYDLEPSNRGEVSRPPEIFENTVSGHKVHANLKMKYEPPVEQEEPVLCSQIKSPLNEETPIDLDLPPLQNIMVPDTYLVQLVSNKRVTPESHWQDVRELNFILPSECNYEPGDTMTIYPKNFPRDVQALIDLQDWNNVADKPLRFAPRQPDYFLAEDLMEIVPPGLYLTPQSTLRDLLTLNLDITAIPKRFFFQAIAHHTDDATHKERLLEFTNPAFTDEFYDYTTRPRRSILEVLQDFPTVRLPWKWVCGFFPVIRGRKYSICSGGVLRNSDQSQYHKIQIIVAIVKYRTVLKKIRQGLCSRYLASLDEGAYLRVGLDDNPDFTKISLCEEPERSIIFVAPGTGVAPCRSLIWERAELSQENDAKVGPCYLFFGGRNRNADYFYKDEWGMKELQVTVFTAFSRDQKEKIYVQDIIRKEGQLIADLLTANILPVIYVCGSSGNMPKAVRAAFVDAVLQHSEEMDRDKCEKQLAMMEKNGLYIQETW